MKKIVSAGLFLGCSLFFNSAYSEPIDNLNSVQLKQEATQIVLAQREGRKQHKREDNRRELKKDRKKHKRQDKRQEHRRKDNRKKARREYRKHRNWNVKRNHWWNHYWRYRVGFSLLTLPYRHTQMVVAGSTYFYSGGVYYITKGKNYVVVGAPIGAHITILPIGFSRIHLGSHRYFYANSVYYSYVPATKNYIVVAKPAGADAAVASGIVAGSELDVYPENNQSEEKLDQDQFECHEWAMEQSGFDPLSSASQEDYLTDYHAELSSCLSSRGYEVN